ncbi:MAG: hypothetical protein HYV41_05255 [Candidatus Magasanikbacteria bacterium]|nr:hypothetical protein [Candidatus Magasanikbacteria bacterium]
MSNPHIKVILVGFLISTQLFVGLFLFARPAYAQDAAVLINWNEVRNSLLSGALGGLMEGVSYFMRKLAYDTAKYAAYGGKGQAALVFKDGFGSYLTNVANDTGATMLNEFAKGAIGLDICAPPDIHQMINLTLGLSSIYGKGPTPSCEWNKFKKSWGEDNLNAMYGSKDALSERFAASLSVVEGDFGVALHTQSKLDKIVNDAVNGALNDRLSGEGFKDVKKMISGDIQTPGQKVAYITQNLTPKDQAAMSTQQIAGIYGAGVLQIIPSTLSVFVNTFMGSLLEQLFTDGLVPSGDASVVDFYASTLNTNREAAERAF